jgi:histone H3/H4
MKGVKFITLSLLPLERILKRAGAPRVSRGALEEMARVLEERVGKVAKHAVALAQHAGRRTVLAEDVRLAKRRVKF